ncbi:MAG: response regulator transcription factor [Hydrogenophaga sp.]|nr:DNA-binding response regulator [Comamonadaceae bacterium]MBS4038491.1 response regulator transcription factor [Hydrogenophaga sp.]
MTATPPDLALPIRVGIVEDDLRVNQSLTAAVNLADGMEMVWSETTRAAALSALARRPVDVLLVDLGLPDGSGIDVIREAHERLPNCDVMVCTIFGDEAHVLQSIEAGAHGYLLKDSPSGTIAEEIRLLRAGGSPISPLIARLVLGRLRPALPAAGPVETADGKPGVSMSRRETEVLELITKGFTYEEIARKLGVTRHTVQTFVRRIYAKLEVGSKIEAINAARQQGLLGP